VSGKPGNRSLAEARDLFLELAEGPVSERADRLTSLAQSDPELARLLESLLEADASADGLLDEGLAGLAPELLDDLGGDSDPAAEPEGRRLGPYRLVTLLGRGGMGEVYLAERTDGEFQQRVALKLLRRGMDSEAIRQRFLRERQVLAGLEHPHIARLLDGGSSDGRPFFVLERVEGQPITAYCRGAAASIEDRVSLMITCCGAVDAAHRQLVVHRDLKPSNILVTADGVVKLLDFGIAKLLTAEPDVSALTRGEERILTPSYAAPEQILGEPVSTATDVYALGVVLYELLTGSLPHDRVAASPAGLASRVEAESLERPSRAVQRASPETLAAAGFAERERERLAQRISGDLDAIVSKALRREPDRRYSSAAALAEDLRRHLEGRPVGARPDTVRYRVRSFTRRHRAGVAVASLAVLALVVGLVASLWQAQRARESAREAQAQSRRAQRVKEFLIGLFEIADPDQSGGESITAKDLVAQGGRRLESELSAEPAVQADLFEAISRIERSLGRVDSARTLAEKSLAVRRRLHADDAALGGSLAALGSALMSQGKLEEAEKHLGEALTLLEKTPADRLAIARVRSDLSQALFWKGRVAEAAEMERRVYDAYRVELGADTVPTAVHLRNLGVLLDELDRLDEAEKAYRDSQAILERRLTPEHPNLAQSYLNLAVFVDQRRNDAAEAETLYGKCLAIRRRTLGPSHPMVGQSLQLYGLFLLNQGRLDESQTLYEEALALFRAIDPRHFEVGKCNNGLALIAARRGHFAAAEERLREVVALFRDVLGEKHPFVWQATSNLAEQIGAQGRLAESETLLRSSLERLEELTGRDSQETAQALCRLGETLRQAGRAGEAVPIERRALEAISKIDPDHLDAALAAARLGASLAELADPAAQREALERLARAESLYRRLRPGDAELAQLLLARGRLALRQGDSAGARRDLEEAVAILTTRLGAAHPRTRAAREVLIASADSRSDTTR